MFPSVGPIKELMYENQIYALVKNKEAAPTLIEWNPIIESLKVDTTANNLNLLAKMVEHGKIHRCEIA